MQAGATWVQGTLNGMGERAGNASLAQVALTLDALYGIRTNLHFDRVRQAALAQFEASHSSHQSVSTAGTAAPVEGGSSRRSGSLPRQMSFAICFGRHRLRIGMNQPNAAQLPHIAPLRQDSIEQISHAVHARKHQPIERIEPGNRRVDRRPSRGRTDLDRRLRKDFSPQLFELCVKRFRHVRRASDEPWEPRRGSHVHGPTRLPIRFDPAPHLAPRQ